MIVMGRPSAGKWRISMAQPACFPRRFIDLHQAAISAGRPGAGLIWISPGGLIPG
jgi:hypothetical protein